MFQINVKVIYVRRLPISFSRVHGSETLGMAFDRFYIRERGL